MNKLDAKLLMTGLLAGITAALLVLGAAAQPTLASILYAASALPVLIVGLGWGNAASITAILTAAFLGTISMSPMFAFGMAIFTLAPAGWLAHLSSLARPASEIGGPDHLIAWYPLSDILLQLCAFVTFAVVALGVIIGFGPEFTDQLVEAMTQAMSSQDPSMLPDPAALEQLKRTMLVLLPIIQGGTWVMLLFLMYYVAQRIVSASGRAKRPREDIPSSLRMNRNAVFLFLAGIIGCFVGGVPAMIGATVCGTFGAGFLMAGFASMHLRTRGKDWRLPALVLAYLSTVMLLPLIIPLIIGLSDTRRTVALTPAAKAETPDNPN
ncbi:hypothetical protein ASE36_01560 [Rhizobium sp. Root274]|uniref:DUF2232 domain-containing protein n=1 Tax=unclassified Rhizobium TaxID=2613769 RepID=UPI0007141065|nr:MULTISPECIES: DUF2232 domain-containing protein [unclassified Rhizobium]KQW31007.1 hypothetical protein ASC71_01560 [Rhizobium sp. Root1240]KRD32555.1 hypothetical protein ASE36_01560 [Rhizobium sp. Root274]